MPDAKITCLDYSGDMLNEARRKAEGLGLPNVTFQQGDVGKLPYPDESFELGSYLRTLPFNYDYLRKLFKTETGSTPLRFLIDTRLQAAAERLDAAGEAPQSISEIAHLCGFREPLYLSRVFRKKYGLSPQQYQNRPRPRISEAPDSEAVKILL